MIKYAKETFINKIDDILLNREPGNSCKTFWQVMGHFMGKKGHQLLYLLYENMMVLMVLMDLRITKTWWFLWIYGLRKHDGSYGFTDYENKMVLMDLRITKTWWFLWIYGLRKHDGSYGFTDYENMMVLMDLRITKTRWFLWIYGLRKQDGSYGFTDYENMMVLMDLRITKTWWFLWIYELRKHDGSNGFTDYETAEELTSYFTSISTIDDTNIELPPFRNRSDVDFTNIQVTESEIIDILKILKLNKATGPDGISNRMLKSACNTVCVPLS